MSAHIALVGDYAPDVTAHRAIPVALELARRALGADLQWRWVRTRDISDAARDLAEIAAVWAVPASPYENTAGAIAAIRWAREMHRPFLGTCGGFQHAMIEFARHAAQLPDASHEETDPHSPDPLISRLSCSLVEATGVVRFTPGSLVRAAYGCDSASEGYRCNYGFNPAYRAALERAGLRFTAFDDTGEIHAAELAAEAHPFFVGTLFQPERAALRGALPPLVHAFARTAVNFSPSR